LQQEAGLRAALFAGDQHFGDGGGFGIGQNAVHVAHEVAAEGIRKRTPRQPPAMQMKIVWTGCGSSFKM